MGADVVREPLFRLAERMPGIPLLRFDLTRCPLPGRSVDVIVMLNVLEHIEDDVLALKKAFGLLRPGGALVIEVPAGPGLYDDYDRELRHFRRYSAGELRRKLEEAGFSVARRSHLGFLLFPFFAAVKLFGIWRSGGGKDGGDAVVRARVARTTDSSLMRLAVYLESKFLSRFSLPFGIRTLAVARRPGGAGGGDL
jgi:SAM-dependent methyltransferase